MPTPFLPLMRDAQSRIIRRSLNLGGAAEIRAYAYDSAGLRRAKRLDGRLVEAFRWLDPLRLVEFYDGRAWWRLVYDPAQSARRKRRTPVGVTDGEAAYPLLCDRLARRVPLPTCPERSYRQCGMPPSVPLRGLQGPSRLLLGFAGGL